MATKCSDEEGVRTSIERMVAKYAEQSPLFLNPDKAVVENIIAGPVKKKIKYVYAYCPCREVEGIPEKDRDNIYPCRTHKDDIARQGTCECGLFVSEPHSDAKKRKI